ncbi:MAG: alpha/beta hydrolase [Alphaproteobacteria bacterium]|nr:alpha/beta hydrolase [Alphaproteobacteria bacterium]
MTDWITRLGLGVDTAGAGARMRRFREGWPAKASPDVAFHRSPNVQFRYRAAGSGPTIVFTADPPMSLETYDAVIATFAERFRVVVLELPAMGFSATSERFRFGFRETGDEIAHFLRAVCGEGAILAFSCAAGLSAIDIAMRAPDLCSRLALIQAGDVAAFEVWKAGRDPKGILAKPIVGQLVMRRLAAKRMPDWYALSVGKRDMIAPFCACAATSFDHGAMWSLASAYQCYLDPRVTLAPPRQPVLSIWGEADRSHPPQNRHSLTRLAPQTQCVTFADLGHTPELEDPARVFAAITAFLDARAAA